MAYRNKPDLRGSPLSPSVREQRRYILWLLPILVIATNSVKIARALGFKAAYHFALYGVVIMGIVCIAGAIISYRSARAEAARDIEGLTHPKGR